MSISEIVSLVCAVLSLCAAILIGVWQIRQNSRINKIEKTRYDNVLYSEATKFILKYSSPDHDSQIFLLPLCVIAYKYNPIYPYSREMYREFCTLQEELQSLILERCELRLKTGRCKAFFDTQIELLESVIKKNYPDDINIFYDRAKYFERALTTYGAQEEPHIECTVDKYQQILYEGNAWPLQKPQRMEYHEHITNLLLYEKTEQPISKLFEEPTSMGCPNKDDELLTSYLCCIIAKYATYYLYRNKEEAIDINCMRNFSDTYTMEDLFLEALLCIYCYGEYKK